MYCIWGKKVHLANSFKFNKLFILKLIFEHYLLFVITFNSISVWHIQNFFGQTSTHIKPMIVVPSIQNLWLQILQKGTSWLCLFLDFFVKHFPNYLRIHYEKLFFVNVWKIHIFKLKICMAIKLWELRSDLSLKDAARCSK